MEPVKVSEREYKHWQTIAESLVSNNPGRKAFYDALIREALEMFRKKMPTADNAVLLVFAESVNALMITMMQAQLQHLPALTDRMFDAYALTAAYLIGAYSLDEPPAKMPDGAGPAPHEVYAPGASGGDAPAEDDAELEALLSRQYL